MCKNNESCYVYSELIIMGNQGTIEYMINNVNSKKRNSGLQNKL